MRKLTIRLKDAELSGLDQILEGFLNLTKDSSNQEKCIYAVLKQWHVAKLKPKTYFLDGKEHKFKLDAPVAFAFLSFFEHMAIQPSAYMGNKILQITAEIDQTFR